MSSNLMQVGPIILVSLFCADTLLITSMIPHKKTSFFIMVIYLFSSAFAGVLHLQITYAIETLIKFSSTLFIMLLNLLTQVIPKKLLFVLKQYDIFLLLFYGRCSSLKAIGLNKDCTKA